MIALILSLIALCLILVVFTYFQRRNNTEEPEIVFQVDEECCGAHEVCDKDTLLSSHDDIVYYDDEDLDKLAGIDSRKYSVAQEKELYDVFITLSESDVAGWLRSLQLRSIEIPVELRDEALLVVSERRAS